MIQRLTTAFLPFVFAATLASAQGKLWIVDQAGGPGTDFTDIQPAVDAASDGDTILLRTGSPAYPAFTIDGKSLVVTEDAGESIRTGDVLVRNVAASQSVTLRGMDTSTLRIELAEGPVLVEDVGQGALIGFCIFGGSNAGKVEVHGSDAVVFSRCIFEAKGGVTAGFEGVRITGSTVHMYETSARGSHPSGTDSAKGGDGVAVFNSFLFASGGAFEGACGGDAGLCAGSGGAGGAGLRIFNSQVFLLETELAGGLGGDGGDCGFQGAMGSPSVGGFTAVAGFARDYAISATATGGTTATIDYAGEPGDVVLSLVALAQSPLFLLQHAGTLVVAAPPILIAHGPADLDGTLSVSAPIPPLPPGFEAFTVYAQGAAISAVGAAVLAAPTQLSIL